MYELPRQNTRTGIYMKKVLLVDDDEELVELLSIKLTQNSFVSVAYNAIEALKLVRKEHFDLIITDFSMPIMDGSSFAKICRTDNIGSKIIVVSSENQITLSKSFSGVDVYKFIQKPYELSSLASLVEKLKLEIEVPNV